MDFISNKQPQIEAMLKELGISGIDELFSEIPKDMKRARPFEDDGMSEWEGMRHMEEVAKKNTFSQYDSYLGGGAYEHHIPSLVAAVCGKSEFLTSYTPYQAEASQGVLQLIFEYQSCICALTGMDVANASLYDGASACAEALLMAARIQPAKNKVLVARSLHPHYCQVIEQYLTSCGIDIEWIPYLANGEIDFSFIRHSLDENTCALLLPYPSFFGVVDHLKSICALAKSAGALSIVCANPIAYGLFASASELGADIAVGDTQPLGLPIQFGGPYAGYLACKSHLVRQMPGRIVGETTDAEGKRGFVLTLQTREQHIRREKATSNICTTQTLAALASLVALLWYGKEGLYRLALTNYQRTAYLKAALERLPNIHTFRAPCFNEFVVGFGLPVEKVFEHFRAHGIEPGIDLGRYYPDLRDHLLVAVTETKSKEALNRYIGAASLLFQEKESSS